MDLAAGMPFPSWPCWLTAARSGAIVVGHGDGVVIPGRRVGDLAQRQDLRWHEGVAVGSGPELAGSPSRPMNM